MSRFLHASLQLRALRECTTRNDLDKVLKGFPPDIADVYAQTWNRITNQPDARASLARATLTWMVFAMRSLTLEELRHAIAMCPDTHQFDPRRLPPVDTLASVCCGLLTVEKETGLVRLVRRSHFTHVATQILKPRQLCT
jgi:ankyrin repeat domain-containing protein 50